MDNIYLLILSVIPFLVTQRYKQRATTIIVLLLSLLYGAISLSSLGLFELPCYVNNLALTPLTAIFALTFCVTFPSILLTHRDEPLKSPLQLSIFYNSTIVLFISVLGVLFSMTPPIVAQSVVAQPPLFEGVVWDFALNWELMGLSSFALLLLGGEKRNILHSAVLYFIVMHIGFVALLGGLISLNDGSGNLFGSSGITLVTSIVLMCGFSVKSAIFPFHFWLPHTYRSSRGVGAALMASSSTNMGLCGIILVLQNSLETLTFSYILIAIGLITTLYGSLWMIRKNSLAGVLSYSSIENSGIILFGIGFSALTRINGLESISALMMVGVILKFVSHALSKSMLFGAVESVQQGVGRNRISNMGGLWRKMPQTTLMYLVGGLSLSAVPLFGGFIAEFLMFTALLMAISTSSVTIIAALAILVLSLAAASVVFNISKSFALAFLGNPRTADAKNASEGSFAGLRNKIGFWFLTLCSTLGSWVLCAWLFGLSETLFGVNLGAESWVIDLFINIMVSFVLLVLLVAVLIVIRQVLTKKSAIRVDPVWTCGYSSETNPKAQYTSESFSNEAMQVVTLPSTSNRPKRSRDISRRISPIRFLGRWTSRLALFQTGHTSHYIMHIIWFLALILILTICSVI